MRSRICGCFQDITFRVFYIYVPIVHYTERRTEADDKKTAHTMYVKHKINVEKKRASSSDDALQRK